MGELLCPCLVQGSMGVVYPVRPQEEQPQWRGSSGNLGSAPAATPSAGPGGSGAGPLMCSAGAGASLLSWALPASACPGGGRILGCVPAPCAPEPALVDSRSRAAAPSAEPPPEPPRAAPGTAQPPLHGASSSARARPSCSRGRAAPSAEPRPEPLELLRVPPCALQPLGSSAHSPGAQVSVSVPGSPGHPRPPGSCSTSLRAPFRPGRSVQLLLLRDGALPSWGYSPRPQPGSSRGPSPLEVFCFFISFFPSSYLDRSANSSHYSIPGVLSLILRPNS